MKALFLPSFISLLKQQVQKITFLSYSQVFESMDNRVLFSAKIAMSADVQHSRLIMIALRVILTQNSL